MHFCKQVFIVFSLLTGTILTSAQTKEIDSLSAAIRNTINQHDKAEMLYRLAVQFLNHDFKKISPIHFKSEPEKGSAFYVILDVR